MKVRSRAALNFPERGWMEGQGAVRQHEVHVRRRRGSSCAAGQTSPAGPEMLA